MQCIVTVGTRNGVCLAGMYDVHYVHTTNVISLTLLSAFYVHTP